MRSTFSGPMKFITLTISLIISGHVLLFYALPFKVFALIFIALAVLFIYTGWQNAILVSVSLVVATLVFSLFLNLSGLSESIYYRPQERFGYFDRELKHRRYEKNVHFAMDMPHGDLKVQALQEVIPEPRKVIFHTDSFGFRNSRDYHGQKYLLVGDSFIVGNGISQDEIITEQLLKEYELNSYNLAHPGDMDNYAKYINSFEKEFGSDYKVLLFLFEGNDFPLPDEEKSLLTSEDVPVLKTIYRKLKNYYKKDYSRLFSKTDVYRFMFSHISRFSHKEKAQAGRIDIRMIEGMPVAFLRDYISVSERDYLPDNPELEKYLESIKSNIAHIFFIPTKYRVYFKHITDLNPGAVNVLPHMQWQLLRQIGNKYDIGVTDLTPALIEESNSLLKEGKLTFWKDDTHWNKYGISIAAKVVAKNMLEQYRP